MSCTAFRIPFEHLDLDNVRGNYLFSSPVEPEWFTKLQGDNLNGSRRTTRREPKWFTKSYRARPIWRRQRDADPSDSDVLYSTHARICIARDIKIYVRVRAIAATVQIPKRYLCPVHSYGKYGSILIAIRRGRSNENSLQMGCSRGGTLPR